MSATRPDLSLVIPAYNESLRLAESISRLDDAVSQGAIDADRCEVILVDDGSTDDTAVIAEGLFERFHSHQIIRLDVNFGKGAAVRRGVAETSGDIVVFMDADMAIFPTQVPALVAALDRADVAIANRTLDGSIQRRGSAVRTLMGRTFNTVVNTVTDVDIADTQCGFKGFTGSSARLLFHFLHIERFAFDVDLLMVARQLGLEITEIAVDWSNDPRGRVRPIDPLSMALDVTRLRLGLVARRRIDVLTLDHDAGAVAAIIDANFPVIALDGGLVAVLLALASGDRKLALAKALADAGLAVHHEESWSFGDLLGHAPLRLLRH